MYYIASNNGAIYAHDIPTKEKAELIYNDFIKCLKEKNVNVEKLNIEILEEDLKMENLKNIEKPEINLFGEQKQSAIILGQIDTQSEEEKIKFFNQVINCEVKIDTILNTPKKIKYIHIDKERLSKPDTAKGYEDTPRVVFYFDDDTSVISFSIGIYNALKRLVSVFGVPPYDFKVIFKQITKGKSRIYTIDIKK